MPAPSHRTCIYVSVLLKLFMNIFIQVNP